MYKAESSKAIYRLPTDITYVGKISLISRATVMIKAQAEFPDSAGERNSFSFIRLYIYTSYHHKNDSGLRSAAL